MVIIAINGKACIDLFDFASRQFIGIHMSPAVINQIFAILSPVGRFNNVVKFLEDRPDSGVYIDRFQNTE